MPVPSSTTLPHPLDMRKHARAASGLLKLLANEDRLLLLCHLSQERLNVGQLEEITGVRQPTLSQQLAILRQEKLVHTEREGKFIYYSLADPKVIQVMRTLWEIYCAPSQGEAS